MHEASNPFSELNSEEQREVAREGEERVFKKGQCLFRSGDAVKGVFCVTSGAVKITQAQGSGEIVIRLASRGEWVGHRSIFTSEIYRGSALAKESVHALFVPTETVLRLFASNKEFAHQLIRLIARDLENTERMLIEQQSLTVPNRLISLFRKLDRKFGVESENGRKLTTKISKVELAEMIGASQEVISRQLSKWKKDSLIREDGKTFYLSKKFLNRITRQ